MTIQMARIVVELVATLLSGDAGLTDWACWIVPAGYWHQNQPWAYVCEYQGTDGRLPYGLTLEKREDGGMILYVGAAG